MRLTKLDWISLYTNCSQQYDNANILRKWGD